MARTRMICVKLDEELAELVYEASKEMKIYVSDLIRAGIKMALLYYKDLLSPELQEKLRKVLWRR